MVTSLEQFVKEFKNETLWEKLIENCKPEKQAWNFTGSEYETVNDLREHPPEKWLVKAFAWVNSPIWQIYELNADWIDFLETADLTKITFFNKK